MYKESRTLKALSLFSGAGGMDIGVMQAGFEILASIEIDPYACETLRANASREKRNTKIIEQDIRKINPLELMKEINLQPGMLDLLFGGPPCQAFSQIGKRRSIHDERGLLLFEMIRFATFFQPRAILIENVKGLLNSPDKNSKPGGVFEHLINQLKQLDYLPKWKIINAAEYGIAQIRKRLFIIAINAKTPDNFQFPHATHGTPDKRKTLFPLAPFVTVGDVISDLGSPSTGNFIPENSHIDITPKGDRLRINGVPEGSHLAAQLHLPPEQRRNLTKKDTTKFKRLSRFAPSNTLRCGEIFFHPEENRYLTPREYMRIHGYPDDYVLRGPVRGRSGRVRYLDQHRQVANSVPPPIAKILAQKIAEVLSANDI